MYRLILFDMDGTLLQGRTIFYFAEKIGFIDKLNKLMESSLEPYEKTIHIACLLKGYSKEDLLSIFQKIPFRPNVYKLISKLKEYNFIIALATDSYDFVANEVKAKLKFDYVYANNLIFKKNICTGEVKILNRDLIKDEITNKIYSISKMHILKKLCDHHGIPIKQSIAVGDGIVDCGMLTKAGIGVAIDASANVNSYADFATNNLMDILTIIKS